jgi:hypothetical protein
MSAQLVKKFKRADLSRAELTLNRASQRATSILSSPNHAYVHADVRGSAGQQRQGDCNCLHVS